MICSESFDVRIYINVYKVFPFHCYIVFMSVKILFCDNSLRELLNFRGEIIEHYAELGYEVVLVAPQNTDFTPVSDKVRFIPLEFKRTSKNPFQDWKYYKNLLKIYKYEKPNYIFHYTIKPNIYGTLAAKRCGIRSSAMVAGLGYVFNKGGIGNRMARYLYKYALRFADFVFVLNTYNYNLLQHFRLAKTNQLIHLKGGEGVNLSHYSPFISSLISDRMIFLMVARVLYDKGYQEYVDTARKVKEQGNDCEFQLLGSIDLEYPDHVAESQVVRDSRFITYLGYSADVVQYMRLADCIVLPSYHEGLSRVLMEALAMGKPIITTDIPGCRETVEDGKNGFLIPPKNTSALVDAVNKFMSIGKKERKRMGDFSRKKAEDEFDIKDVIQVYQKITDELTEKVKNN